MKELGVDYGEIYQLGWRIDKSYLNLSGFPERFPGLTPSVYLIGANDVLHGQKLYICENLADMRTVYKLSQFPHQVHWYTAPRSKVDQELQKRQTEKNENNG